MMVYFYWSHCLWLLFITIGRTAPTNCSESFFFFCCKKSCFVHSHWKYLLPSWDIESLELGHWYCLLNVLLCLVLQSRISAPLRVVSLGQFFNHLLPKQLSWPLLGEEFVVAQSWCSHWLLLWPLTIIKGTARTPPNKARLGWNGWLRKGKSKVVYNAFISLHF